ncbi:glycosyltransferase family 9 protein [Azonexus sp. IMCC34839]|uniref:glycosyltransferase family 9 protein n=1 Tax=Azonexus sp. IMCC34839 TaxID=3133695 RepID=UPI00399B1396
MKILIIRRDNIGDLILTTPLISALRAAQSEATIDILVNSYCAPVLLGNPNLNNIYVYDKGHHRGSKSLAKAYWERIKLLFRLRRKQYDSIIIAKPNVEKRPYRLAKIVGAKRIYGVVAPGSVYENLISNPIHVAPSIRHVADISFQIAKEFGSDIQCGKTQIFPDRALIEIAESKRSENLGYSGKTVAIQISSRKIKQRWQIEKFAALMRYLHDRDGCVFQVYWSPGSVDNPMHPGDDENAIHLQSLLGGSIPALFCRTETLVELAASLATNDLMITSDGGALHIGAALGLPIVCFFGNSEAVRWHPWQVPYELLQVDSSDVRDISVDMAIDAYDRLLEQFSHKQIGNLPTTTPNL